MRRVEPQVVAAGLGAGAMVLALFKLLHFFLRDAFWPLIGALLAIAVGGSLLLALAFRHRPSRWAPRQANPPPPPGERPLGRGMRALLLAIGLACTALAIVAGGIAATTPDLGVFALLWALPAAWVALAALIAAARGRLQAPADASVWGLLLWPW